MGGAAFGDYCSASGEDYFYEYIWKVEVWTIDNATAGSSYSDYTDLSTELYIDYGYLITVTNGDAYSGDGKVNWEDFDLFAEWWMARGCGACGGADFTGDGNVNYLDLDVFARYWLKSEYGDCGGAELTGDGAVRLGDLQRFTASWLAGIW